MFKSHLIAVALALLIALNNADKGLDNAGVFVEKPVLGFFKSATELLQRSGNPSIPDVITIQGDHKNVKGEITLKAVLEDRDTHTTPNDWTPNVHIVGDRNTVRYSIVNGTCQEDDISSSERSVDVSTHASSNPKPKTHSNVNIPFVFKPQLFVNGSYNNITYIAYFNGTLVNKDMELLEDLYSNLPPKRSKIFHISKYLESTWTKALEYCNNRKMKLAAFDSKEEYSTVLEKIKIERLNGEFWISAARMTIFPELGPRQHFFFPSLTPVSDIFKGKLEVQPSGDCVYVAVSSTPGNAAAPKDTWRTDDCAKTKRRFICQEEVLTDPFFERLNGAAFGNVPAGARTIDEVADESI